MDVKFFISLPQTQNNGRNRGSIFRGPFPYFNCVTFPISYGCEIFIKHLYGRDLSQFKTFRFTGPRKNGPTAPVLTGPSLLKNSIWLNVLGLRDISRGSNLNTSRRALNVIYGKPPALTGLPTWSFKGFSAVTGNIIGDAAKLSAGVITSIWRGIVTARDGMRMDGVFIIRNKVLQS